MAVVLVLVERAGAGAGPVRKTTLELLTLARRLGEPAAVLCGPADAPVLAALAGHGAATVYVADTDVDVPVVGQVDALAAAAERVAPAAILVTAGPDGTDVAARLAVRLDSGLVTGAVDVTPGPDGPIVTQSAVGGAWTVRGRIRRGTPVIAVRPNSAHPEPVADAAAPSVVALDVAPIDPARTARVVARTPRPATGRPELSDAAVVVTGGRGVGSPEAFAVIERLADTLGAAVGATRAVTDLAWRPHEMQIGQTGKTVTPRLYIAGGVSGAIQHLAGMQGSRTIVAVNRDPKAPIFGVADFGVVGDLHTVLPALIDEIAKRRA